MLSAALIVCATVAGTLAWLTDTTAPVVNTFTVGDINITLTESENLKMVPGRTITKDPKVTVKEGSEACWLFVKVVKSENFKDFMTYDKADGWTLLKTEGNTEVYYREVAATTADTDISVLKDNKVTVRDTVTKTMLEGVKTNAPTLTFTAYAVQKEGINDADTAWRKVNP